MSDVPGAVPVMCLRPILVSVPIGAALWALVIWAALS